MIEILCVLGELVALAWFRVLCDYFLTSNMRNSGE